MVALGAHIPRDPGSTPGGATNPATGKCGFRKMAKIKTIEEVEKGIKELIPGIATQVNELKTAMKGLVPFVELNANALRRLADLAEGHLLTIKRSGNKVNISIE